MTKDNAQRSALVEKAQVFCDNREDAEGSIGSVYECMADFALEIANSRWVPVEERLPEVDVDVLVTDGYIYEVAFYSDGDWATESLSRVRAWMPIPLYEAE